MRLKHSLLTILIICLSFTVMADEVLVQKNEDVQILLSNVVIANLNLAQKMPSDSINNKDYETLNDAINKLRFQVFDAYNNGNQKYLNNFFEELKNLDPYTKSVIQEEIIIPLEEYSVHQSEQTRSEVIYIPGYGYTDPNYLYKLGRELDSEHLQNFWKEEKKVLEEHKKYKYYVEMSVATEMAQNGGSNGKIEGFEITGKAVFNVNGELKEYAQVEFEMKETIETKAMLMYEKRKVTFELFKAKESFWNWLGNGMDFKWVYAGKCFLYKEFPAKTDEIYAPELLENIM